MSSVQTRSCTDVEERIENGACYTEISFITVNYINFGLHCLEKLCQQKYRTSWLNKIGVRFKGFTRAFSSEAGEEEQGRLLQRQLGQEPPCFPLCIASFKLVFICINVNTNNLHILAAQKLTHKINFEHENFKVRIPFALISKKI